MFANYREKKFLKVETIITALSHQNHTTINIYLLKQWRLSIIDVLHQEAKTYTVECISFSNSAQISHENTVIDW